MTEVKFTFEDSVMEQHPEILEAITAWVKRQIPEVTVELDGEVQDEGAKEKNWQADEAAKADEEATLKKEKEKETKDFAQRVDERIASISDDDPRVSHISPYNKPRLYSAKYAEATMEIISEDLEQEAKSYKETGKVYGHGYTY